MIPKYILLIHPPYVSPLPYIALMYLHLLSQSSSKENKGCNQYDHFSRTEMGSLLHSILHCANNKFPIHTKPSTHPANPWYPKRSCHRSHFVQVDLLSMMNHAVINIMDPIVLVVLCARNMRYPWLLGVFAPWCQSFFVETISNSGWHCHAVCSCRRWWLKSLVYHHRTL